MEHNERDATARASLNGATATGKRPSRSHDFHFLGGPNDSLAIVGREIRRDWSQQEQTEPAILQVFARLAVSFLPLGAGRPASLERKFTKGFRAIVEQCQRELQELGEAPALALTLAHACGPHLYVGHVGDSRCYVVRGRELIRVTSDHTYTPQPPDRPLVSDPALSRNLSSVIGGFSDDLRIDTKQVSLFKADTVLLCTAGVARAVSDEELRQLLVGRLGEVDGSLQTIASAVIEASSEGPDEADRTVVVAKFA